MDDTVQPDSYIVLRLPSGLFKIIHIKPNIIISLGKYGEFPSNLLLGRPFHSSYEILESKNALSTLRRINATELNAEILLDNATADADSGHATPGLDLTAAEYEAMCDPEYTVTRNNRLTVDDPSNQAMTMEDIEVLKKTETDSGRDVIAKIMQSHSTLNQKTQFALAKYKQRKSQKYLRRFTVLPVTITVLLEWLSFEKDTSRIMDIRAEMLGLILSWANVHRCDPPVQDRATSETNLSLSDGRWLVIDDTGGLVVGAMAERMGILNPTVDAASPDEVPQYIATSEPEPALTNKGANSEDHAMTNGFSEANTEKATQEPLSSVKHRNHDLAGTNTITVLHTSTQPNLSLLNYFAFDASSAHPSIAQVKHPLYRHLYTLSWLQLLEPNADTVYSQPPPVLPDDEISALKSGKRSVYFKKQRRWHRTKRMIDATREGGFAGLVICSQMSDLGSIFKHTVPLLTGGATVVCYSRTVEPLAELADYYSRARRAAFAQRMNAGEDPADLEEDPDFLLDPRLLLGASVQTVRARAWQVLPGRTHPEMTGKGGSEGYLFTATRVIPIEGHVHARGRFTKKRKLDEEPSCEGGDSRGDSTV